MIFGKNDADKDAMVRRGYADAAERIQELFLAGRREDAINAVPRRVCSMDQKPQAPRFPKK